LYASKALPACFFRVFLGFFLSLGGVQVLLLIAVIIVDGMLGRQWA